MQRGVAWLSLSRRDHERSSQHNRSDLPVMFEKTPMNVGSCDTNVRLSTHLVVDKVVVLLMEVENF